MTPGVPPLPGLLAFEASARHLGFAAAAAELHLSPSAVSQRVRVLERHLGTPLFQRRARSLRLTSAGEAYLPAVRDLFEGLSAATSGVFGGSGREVLIVRAQVSYAATWLAPRLPAFAAAYPHVDVHLVSAIWTDTLGPDDSDVEIRQGTGSWKGFRATRLHEDHAVAVHGPAYDGDVDALVDRPRVQVLGLDQAWRRYAVERTPDESAWSTPAALTVDTTVAALEIVATSDLWALVPERFARRDVRAGRLRLAPGDAVPMQQGHFLLRRDTAERVSGASAAFERWLLEQDAADPPL